MITNYGVNLFCWVCRCHIHPRSQRKIFALSCHKCSSLSKKYQRLARAMGGIYFFTSFLSNWAKFLNIGWKYLTALRKPRRANSCHKLKWKCDNFSIFLSIFARYSYWCLIYNKNGRNLLWFGFVTYFRVNETHGIELTLLPNSMSLW